MNKDYLQNLTSLAKIETLEMNHFFLRRIELGDLLDYHELTSNDEALKFDYPAHKNLEESLHMLVKWNLSSPIGRYGIFNKSDQKLIGNISLTLSDDGDTCTLGYALNQKYWRRGITSFCVNELISYVSMHLNIKYIVAKVHQENIGSIKLLEKLSFIKTGEEEVSSLRYNHFIEETYTLKILQ